MKDLTDHSTWDVMELTGNHTTSFVIKILFLLNFNFNICSLTSSMKIIKNFIFFSVTFVQF